jgi:hypothetical protein
MSKIAEKKALEEYPLPQEESESTAFINQETFNSAKRVGYIKGYDKALQDFLNKACNWLESNFIDKEIVSMGIWHKFTDKDIEQFKNYMDKE